MRAWILKTTSPDLLGYQPLRPNLESAAMLNPRRTVSSSARLSSALSCKLDALPLDTYVQNQGHQFYSIIQYCKYILNKPSKSILAGTPLIRQKFVMKAYNINGQFYKVSVLCYRQQDTATGKSFLEESPPPRSGSPTATEKDILVGCSSAQPAQSHTPWCHWCHFSAPFILTRRQYLIPRAYPSCLKLT